MKQVEIHIMPMLLVLMNIDALYLPHMPTKFPLRPENLEKWKGIFQSGYFEQTGKSQGKSHKILEKTKVLCHVCV